ncbi:LA2681 family HEPN domain-containing protein [Bacillus sp. SB49]|uniref:LA2681 family HEPN domain-containing protein n=1 Tax=Bacillus sp. SB49 TaxID=1071080 RepID=UPI003FA44ADD
MNQIKQDYVSTRFLLFDSIKPKSKVHFSDKNVHQVDTLDYAIHSLSDFKIKMVFKSAHSLFDKIAYLINEYYQTEIKEKDVNFNTIWKSEHGNKKEGTSIKTLLYKRQYITYH